MIAFLKTTFRCVEKRLCWGQHHAEFPRAIPGDCLAQIPNKMHVQSRKREHTYLVCFLQGMVDLHARFNRFNAGKSLFQLFQLQISRFLVVCKRLMDFQVEQILGKNFHLHFVKIAVLSLIL